MDLYIGLDLGTSGCRGVAIDEGGTIRANRRVALSAPHRHGPAVEQAPAVWWDAVIQVLGGLLRQVPPNTLRAIAVDGTSASLLVTDARGRPLAPALMYNDSRCRSEAARVARGAPPESAAHGPTSSLAKLLHLQSRYPEARHALHQADWIAARLAGDYSVCDENNALKLGFDPVKRRWPAWLATLHVREELLPRPRPPGTPVGIVTPELAREWGLPRDVKVVAGTTDSVAAFLATGASRPGEAVTSLGSTLVLKVISKRPIFAARYGVYSHRIGDRWLAGGASNSGGAVLLDFFSPVQIETMTRALRPNEPTGLDYYPLHAAGERFPISDPNLAPHLHPRPDDDLSFFQGILEGISAIECRGYRLLAELGAPYPNSVQTVGGGAGNPAWTAIRARLLRVPVLTAVQQEAAYGAAILARISHQDARQTA